MDAEKRRESIKAQLLQQEEPVSASRLAQQLGVSRQIIVGDIALLRTQGCDIVATARGYMRAKAVVSGRYVGKIACQHSLADTKNELYTIVELGGQVLDVVVEHELYGEITGQLNLASCSDVNAFLQKVANNEARLLSELTDGVHLHTIACRDAAAFETIRAALARQSLLYAP